MKLFSLNILFKASSEKANILISTHELSSFGYFQRSSVQEFMEFSAKIISQRTHCTMRQSVKEKDYLCHVYVRTDSLAAVVISDYEYPSRVAFTLLTQILEDFSNKYPANTWPEATVNSFPFVQTAADYLQRFQNPREADKMTKIMDELDETKIILHNTIDAVLERGEKLDDLVQKSEGLSMQSKTFYKTAKKTNSCCVIL